MVYKAVVIINCVRRARHRFSNNAAVYGASVATPTLALHVSAGTLLKHRALPLVPFNATVVTRDYFGNTVSQATGMRIVASLAPESSVACRLPAPPIVGVTQGVAAFTSIAVGASPATTCTLAFTAEPKEAGLPPDLNVDLELEACHVGSVTAQPARASAVPWCWF